MNRSPMVAGRTGVLVPSGMLGAGFDPATIERGLSLQPDVIAVARHMMRRSLVGVVYDIPLLK